VWGEGVTTKGRARRVLGGWVVNVVRKGGWLREGLPLAGGGREGVIDTREGCRVRAGLRGGGRVFGECGRIFEGGRRRRYLRSG